MTTLTPQDIRTLEQTRQRLYQLTDALNSLNRDIYAAHPLPSWSSLQSRLSILSTHLTSLSTHLASSASTLDATSIFPLPSFPGSAQEPVLAQLLRKRLEPGVEEWVGEGLQRGNEAVGSAGGVEEEGMGGEEGNNWKELWDWAPLRANEEARGYEWLTGEWTPEERKEGMDEDEGEEKGDIEEQEEEEGGGKGLAEGEAKGMRMEEVLRFMSMGDGMRRS
ncbi:MAG: hypothetical protein Q9201_003592 [Fulgogasparrea decipioides]